MKKNKFTGKQLGILFGTYCIDPFTFNREFSKLTAKGATDCYKEITRLNHEKEDRRLRLELYMLNRSPLEKLMDLIG
jgi:hypothetical protein